MGFLIFIFSWENAILFSHWLYEFYLVLENTHNTAQSLLLVLCSESHLKVLGELYEVPRMEYRSAMKKAHAITTIPSLSHLFPQQCIRIPFSSHTLQHLPFSVFGVITILTSVNLYYPAILTWISQIINMFSCLLFLHTLSTFLK